MALHVEGTSRTFQPPVVWPSASSTGYAAAGATLTPYVSSNIFWDTGTVTLDSKTISTTVQVAGADVTLTRCNILDHVFVYSGSITLIDCNVNAGTWHGPAVGGNGITVRRCYIEGGGQGVSTSGNCLVEDSVLTDQFPLDPGDVTHQEGFLSNGGGNIIVRRNFIHATSSPNGDGGAPSANLSLFGDFDECHDIVIDRNYFPTVDAGYGMYLGYLPRKPYFNPRNIIVRYNVFEFYPTNHYNANTDTIVGFLPANGNVFLGNEYIDRSPVVLPDAPVPPWLA